MFRNKISMSQTCMYDLKTKNFQLVTVFEATRYLFFEYPGAFQPLPLSSIPRY